MKNLTNTEFLILLKQSPIFQKHDSILIIIKDDSNDDISFLEYLLEDYISGVFNNGNYIRLTNNAIGSSILSHLERNNQEYNYNNNLTLKISDCKNNKLYRLLKYGNTPNYFPKKLDFNT